MLNECHPAEFTKKSEKPPRTPPSQEQSGWGPEARAQADSPAGPQRPCGAKAAPSAVTWADVVTQRTTGFNLHSNVFKAVKEGSLLQTPSCHAGLIHASTPGLPGMAAAPIHALRHRCSVSMETGRTQGRTGQKEATWPQILLSEKHASQFHSSEHWQPHSQFISSAIRHVIGSDTASRSRARGSARQDEHGHPESPGGQRECKPRKMPGPNAVRNHQQR